MAIAHPASSNAGMKMLLYASGVRCTPSRRSEDVVSLAVSMNVIQSYRPHHASIALFVSATCVR